jgi:hypothetical protein
MYGRQGSPEMEGMATASESHAIKVDVEAYVGEEFGCEHRCLGSGES